MWEGLLTVNGTIPWLGPRLSKWKRKLSRGHFFLILIVYTMLPDASSSQCLDFSSRLTRDFLVPKSFFPRVSLVWVFHCKKRVFYFFKAHVSMTEIINVGPGDSDSGPQICYTSTLTHWATSPAPSLCCCLSGGCMLRTIKSLGQNEWNSPGPEAPMS